MGNYDDVKDLEEVSLSNLVKGLTEHEMLLYSTKLDKKYLQVIKESPPYFTEAFAELNVDMCMRCYCGIRFKRIVLLYSEEDQLDREAHDYLSSRTCNLQIITGIEEDLFATEERNCNMIRLVSEKEQ